MINKWSTYITSSICNNASISSADAEKIHYALVAIIGEVFKLIILISIFGILGKLKPFLFSLAILFSIRTFAGGIHLNSSFNCLVASIVFFLITCLMPGFLIKVDLIYYYIILFSCIAIVLLGSPKPSIHRPIINKKRKRNLKIISTFSTLIWSCILLIYVKDISLLNCGILTICMQSIQLIHIKNN